MFEIVGAGTHTALLIVVLIVGFVALVYGADWLVDGASGLAKRFNVSDLVIGLTIVAFGTSMPEFVVNMISATSSTPNDLAITNILGSNAINIFVILGLTALIWPVSSKPQTRQVDLPFAVVGSLIVLFCACYTLKWTNGLEQWRGFRIYQTGEDCISWIGGLVLLALFCIYMYYLAKHAKEAPEEGESFQPMAVWKAMLLIVVGLVCLTIGGECIVQSATEMAHRMGIGDAIIGLTIVALGTSLPELATSCMAAAKHNSDLALGNCVGSCTFNVFFVLAISGIVTPLKAYDGLWLDAVMSLAGPLLVWIFVKFNKQKKITRVAGGTLLLIYTVYLTYRLLSL